MSEGDTSRAVRLPLDASDFDLRQVLNAVGDWSHLRWVLRQAWFNGDVRSVWAAGWEYAEAESERPGGIQMTWDEMARLADNCLQVIDGRFTGYGDDGQPVLQLLAVDSSYWVVWARDDQTLDRVRAAFSRVEPYYEPTPEPLPNSGG
jgi:hypothetical protein